MGGRFSGVGSFLEWAVASIMVPMERVSGDGFVVKELPGGVLIGVFDGLGHGEEAASAARCAAETVQASGGVALVPLMRRCHEALIGTRGVVMTLVSIDAAQNSLTWIGIGNVEGVVLHMQSQAQRARRHVILRGGVIGHALPTLRPSKDTIEPGDLLILATDGIHPEFLVGVNIGRSVQQVADEILAKHATGQDDGLVLVARFGKS